MEHLPRLVRIGETSSPMTAVSINQATELTIFDIGMGGARPATQEDIDRMQEFIFALISQPEGRLVTDRDINVGDEKFDFLLAIYPNRARPDGVYVAELKEVKPYAGISNMDGSPCYPSLPDTKYRLGSQLPTNFAREIVRRWNIVSSRCGVEASEEMRDGIINQK